MEEAKEDVYYESESDIVGWNHDSLSQSTLLCDQGQTIEMCLYEN